MKERLYFVLIIILVQMVARAGRGDENFTIAYKQPININI